MGSCLSSVQTRLSREACLLESVTLVRALDKISGKLQAMDKLLPSAGLSKCVCDNTIILYRKDKSKALVTHHAILAHVDKPIKLTML